jgi:hypothetical protein
VIGIQDYEHWIASIDPALHLGNDFRSDRGPLDHLDPASHRVGFDRSPIVRSNFYVDAKNSPFRLGGINDLAAFDRVGIVEHGQDRRTEDERSPVRNTGLDDELGLHGTNYLLQGDDVLRALDNGPVQPAKSIGVACGYGSQKKITRCLPQRAHVVHEVTPAPPKGSDAIWILLRALLFLVGAARQLPRRDSSFAYRLIQPLPIAPERERLVGNLLMSPELESKLPAILLEPCFDKLANGDWLSGANVEYPGVGV